MARKNSSNWDYQDLRNYSFRGRDLRGANFRGSDIRGCDFHGARLVGANFTGVRGGLTIRRLAIGALLLAVVSFLMATAVSRTLFSALGEPFGGKSWFYYLLPLAVSLGLGGGGAGLKNWVASRYDRAVLALSAAGSGSLLAFFYGGLAGNSIVQAGAAAIAGGTLGGLIGWRFRAKAVTLVVASAGAIAAYGAAFWLWAVAITLLSVNKLLWGIPLGFLSLTYILLAVNSVSLAIKKLKSFAGTSFRNADLTNALFDGASLKNTDFSGAVGLEGVAKSPL